MTRRRPAPSHDARTTLRAPRAPFIVATSLAAGAYAASGFIDLLGDSVNVSHPWTWWWIFVGFAIAASPLLWRGRFPPALPLAACYLVGGVTSAQIAVSTDSVQIVDNMVLYPMLSCYLGWFYWRWVARVTVAFLFTLSGLAIAIPGQWDVATTWSNLALGSLFCLEASLYLRRRLDEKVETDPLTGARNRSGMDRQLTLEMVRCARAKEPLSIVLIDLDHFKQINDEHGHARGDLTLVNVVLGLKAALRPQDVVTRMGGDEFVIILPGLDIVAADRLARRLASTAVTPWTYGVAQARGVEPPQELIVRADGDLYFHKTRPDDLLDGPPLS